MKLKRRCSLFFLLLTGSVCTSVSAQNSKESHYVLKEETINLEGQWHLVMSTSREWKRTSDVTFTFQAKAGGMTAVIGSLKKGKAKMKLATETVTGASAIKEHRDKGIFHKRHIWYVVAIANDKHWMIVYYGKNFFGGESLAVLSRNAVLTENDKVEISRLFKENYFLHAKSKHIKEISGTDHPLH